ncbi:MULTISPECIES: MBL fold metallo-hydrolase [Herbaspirillum]|uniref:Metal-dependent hydrolase n=1 Tax=Herbaspirillum frisingense GSF30 TaxID=864073 RepID=A0AAI9IFI5_9BURK|nr:MULTISPECIES: MBL fold metallo-hydrolase [Herbaspirillum]EOA05089.1 metal-dependent hydrolase [Herbaspirillum frisingense GSF30]MCI1013223.1 MBL fold metallo-hydrolase [Herbaspirillum sp. C7C2]QNB07887.1 MBL fold metallo-hydrolase [Herbaspirillum frisingense]
MNVAAKLKYYGWSSIALETSHGALFFDPFYRPYCGAEWFHLDDFMHAKYICVTHGHEEHFLDVPEVAKATGACVIGAPSLTRFMQRRHKFTPAQLRAIEPASFDSVSVPGFKITALPWQHRDINLYKALTKAVFKGNTTQLAWAWSSATNAPFYSPYTGFHVELPDGTTILNYNEGFNSKMTDAEIEALGRRFKTDILLAGMQLDFIQDVVRGVAALKPQVVVLYPPHEKFHEMMEVSSRPWSEFADAVRSRFPHIRVHVAEPGFELEVPQNLVTSVLDQAA